MRRAALPLVATLVLSACYFTVRHVWEPASLDQRGLSSNSMDKLKAGDLARVTTKEGDVRVFRVVEPADDSFVGDADGKRYRVTYALLRSLEIQHPDPTVVDLMPRLPPVPIGLYP